MKDKELLEEAKRRYPVGTRFVCRNSDCIGTISTGVFRVGINDCEELYVNEVDRMGNYVMTGTDYHCIYSDDKWSETLETECIEVKQYTKEDMKDFAWFFMCEYVNNKNLLPTTELFDLWVKSKEDKDEKS